MIFLAKFRGDLTPMVIDVEVPPPDAPFWAIADGVAPEVRLAERAADRIEAEVRERPVTCQELPPGLLFCEVKFPTPDDEEDGNSADVSAEGVALEPLAEFAEWLDLADAADLAALAPTEPPAEENSNA